MGKNFRNILIFGATGQIGSNLADVLEGQKKLILPAKNEADFSNPGEIEKHLLNLSEVPDIIINAAAYTAVDKAEEEAGLADKVNHISVKKIAKYCADNKIPLIHYSTDYVYDGKEQEAFSEEDEGKLKPLSVYGKTKLAGDRAVQDSGCEYIILRTSWVYDHSGKNFVKTILKLACEREDLKIVSDQVGAPTYAYDIAKVTAKIIDRLPQLPEFPSGIYNACPSEYISWFEFAERIVKLAKESGFEVKAEKILPIPTSEYPTPAKRPLNSRLSVKKLANVFNIRFPNIDSSLEKLFRHI